MAKTLQEIFDITVQHLAKQKCQAIDIKDMCMYRASNGKKCAYGIHIPDEEYRLEFENKSSDVLNLQLGYVAPAFRGEDNKFATPSHATLARMLQVAHDSCVSLNVLKRDLTYLARQFSLDASLVNTITEWGAS